MALPQPSMAQLRPALQLALEVARVPGPARPGRVRSLVRGRRLPANWRVTMAQVLAEDDGFRAEVAAAATEEGVGPLAWLWLTRPDGWTGSLEAALEAEAAASAAEDERRRLEGRLAGTEEELARARAEIDAARERQEQLAARLDEVAGAAARLEGQLADAQSTITSLTAEVGRRDDALGRYEAEIAAVRAEPARLRSELEEVRSHLAEAHSGRARAEADARRATDAALAADERARAVSSELVRLRRAAAEALRGAARGARQVDAAVSEALSALGAGERAPAAPAPGTPVVGGEAPAGAAPGAAAPAAGMAVAGGGGPGAGVPAGPAPGGGARPGRSAPGGEPGPGAGAGRRRPGGPGRRPIPLPPAVFEDSPEAAEYLVRRAGVHLIVDGYNVAFRSWSGDDLPALRTRLVDALSELAVRVKRQVTVVFDGAAEGGRVKVAPVSRPWLRVVFSASTEEADEVIVAAVGELPAGTAVAVATDDRQVRSDVRALGANVITVQQLLSVLRRTGGADAAG